MSKTKRERGWHMKQVTLECPDCGRTKKAWRHHSDPPLTARVVATCDRCPGENGIVDYFDAEGRQIDLDGQPLTAGASPCQDRGAG